MDALLILGGLIFLGLIVLMASHFGKDPAKKTASQLRAMIEGVYDGAWYAGKERGEVDPDARDHALVDTLYAASDAEKDWISLPTNERHALMVEALPFKRLDTYEESRRAIVEYVVWREYPDQADVNLIRNAVENMVDTLYRNDREALSTLRNSEFAWAKLLPETGVNQNDPLPESC